MNKINHSFYTFMSVLSLILIVLGFGNFYGGKIISGNGYLSTSIHIHGAIFISWMIFFLLQNVLVLKNKTHLHKKIGPIGFFLALAMLISAIYTTYEVTELGHRGFDGLLFTSPKAFLILNFNAILIFTLLVFLGLYYKNSPETHKRLMLMSTIVGLTPPGISRVPFITGSELKISLFTAIFISIAPVYEYIKTKELHAAYKYSLPLVIFILPPVVELLAKLF